MGVVNVTPDSFSDGGLHLDPDDAVRHVDQMILDGASWIDVGGESTRPGASPVDPDEEQRRVVPVIEAIAERCAVAGVGISIDTRNAATAASAVRAGATLINDVSAELYAVAADLGVGWVAMHMSGDPRTMQTDPHYDNVVDDVRRFLVERAESARSAGVECVWVDPGIGFGKTTAHNMDLLAHLDQLVDEGYPVLVGTSRKRFTGELLARSDAAVHGRDVGEIAVADRIDGSLASATWAITLGASMVRVHDVAATAVAAGIVGHRPGRVPAVLPSLSGQVGAPVPDDRR